MATGAVFHTTTPFWSGKTPLIREVVVSEVKILPPLLLVEHFLLGAGPSLLDVLGRFLFAFLRDSHFGRAGSLLLHSVHSLLVREGFTNKRGSSPRSKDITSLAPRGALPLGSRTISTRCPRSLLVCLPPRQPLWKSRKFTPPLSVLCKLWLSHHSFKVENPRSAYC